MTKRLEGKLALVTGGSRGIGAAIAEAYAREGAKVVIASRKQAGLDQTASAINEKYKDSTIPKTCHVGHADQVQGLIDFIDKELGTLDVLVNNAGTNPYFGPMLGISPELFDKTFQVNLKGVFEPTRYAVAKWTEKEKPGVDQGGHHLHDQDVGGGAGDVGDTN
jgi:NAD(P)-dependent dehydrogenase (short-subunit alcohol dehydrogenase family)